MSTPVRICYPLLMPQIIQHVIVLQKVDSGRQWKALLVNCELGTREVFPACSKARGSPIVASLCLVDLKGFRLVFQGYICKRRIFHFRPSLPKFWSAKSHLKAAFQIAQDYYPETYVTLGCL